MPSQVLSLDDNAMQSWSAVAGTLGTLPALQRLLLARNALRDVEAPTAPGALPAHS